MPRIRLLPSGLKSIVFPFPIFTPPSMHQSSHTSTLHLTLTVPPKVFTRPSRFTIITLALKTSIIESRLGTTVPTTPQDHIIRWRIRYTEFAEVLIHSILQWEECLLLLFTLICVNLPRVVYGLYLNIILFCGPEHVASLCRKNNTIRLPVSFYVIATL